MISYIKCLIFVKVKVEDEVSAARWRSDTIKNIKNKKFNLRLRSD